MTGIDELNNQIINYLAKILRILFILVVVALPCFALLSMALDWGVSMYYFAPVFIFATIAVGILIYCIYWFTRLLPEEECDSGKENDEALKKNLKQRWITITYSFMVVALVVSVIPFKFDWVFKKENIDSLKNQPVSVLVGCTLESEHIPNELHCAGSASGVKGDAEKSNGKSITDYYYMWVINLGGSVEQCDTLGDKNNQYITNCRIRGGLVVPLYVVILALFGGAISLTRRIPEYQKRASSNYHSTEEAPKIDMPLLREYLVFQIVQFVSAPFIAIVAYYTITPTSVIASVTVAFGAGFASESILVMIRAIFDKVTPDTKRPVNTGSVCGVVMDKDNQLIENVSIEILDASGVHPLKTDANGCFSIDNVIEGEHVLKASFNGTREVLRQIDVKTGVAATYKITLPN